jgi:iron complex outermembrane receptor protein
LDDLSLVDLLKLDLRVVSTKTDTTVEASPAAVIVVTREDIDRFRYRSVEEALRDVVGVFAVTDHITPNVGVRGVPGGAYEGSGAVKVMIDSVPVAFRTTGENWLGPSLIPMSAVERIEIVKGPTSSLYGADAFLGVINVITRPSWRENWARVGVSGSSSFEGGPGYRLDATTGLRMGRWLLLASGQFDGEDRSGLPLPSTSPAANLADPGLTTSANQDLQDSAALLRLTYEKNRKTHLSLTGRYARHQAAGEFAPWLQLSNTADPSTGTWSSLHQGTLTLDGRTELDRRFQIAAVATGFFGGTLADDRIDTGNSAYTVNRDLSYHGVEGSVEGIWTPTDELRLVAAGEAQTDEEHFGIPRLRARSDGSPLPSVSTSTDLQKSLVNLAARAQLTWKAIPRFLVPTGGIRYDHNSVYGDRISGRMAVVSEVLDRLYLKGIYGTAFKAASPLLLYGRPLDAGDVIGSPELGAQQMRALEFVTHYGSGGALELEASASRWELIDRAEFRPQGVNLVARSSAAAIGYTIEAHAKTSLPDVVGGSVSIEWNTVERQSGEVGYRADLFGTDQAIYPEYVARARAWTRTGSLPLEVWTAGAFVGPRNASDSNTLAAAERYVLPAYPVLDAGVRTIDLQWIGSGVTEFSLSGRNILDTAFVQPGFFGVDYPAIAPRIFLEVRQEL